MSFNFVSRCFLCCIAILSNFASHQQRSFAQSELTNIPEPDPVAELAAMQLSDGIEVTLFAADEFLTKPVHTNFGVDGKLYVATSETYPQLTPGEPANDKILVLQDQDGDGKCDSSTVFADGLLIPTGVLPAVPNATGQAVYVAASTQLLCFTDTDGDNVADQRRVVFDGFGTEDTHHLLHTLRWGTDGCLYMNQSIYIHSHVPTKYGTMHLNGGGIWRYDPATDQLTVVAKGFINPWGHAIDRHGQSYITDGAYYEGINPIFQGAVYATSPGATRWFHGLNPGSPKHCGLEIDPYDSDAESMTMITADFRSHRVNRFSVTRTESGYVSTSQPDLIRSEHVAFRPIDIKAAANDDLYIADWYNPIIQHGEVDFRDDRRDRTHGRIWRVHHRDSANKNRTAFVDLAASNEQVVELLQNESLTTQSWARLVLISRFDANVENALNNFVVAQSDEAGRENRKLQRAWILAAVKQLPWADVTDLARAKDATIRAAAVRLALNHFIDDPAVLDLADSTIVDSDWLVRLESIALLQKYSEVHNVVTIDSAIKSRGAPVNDSLDYALWQLIQTHDRDIVPPGVPDQVAARMPRLTDLSWLKELSFDELSFVLQSNPNPAWVAATIDKTRDMSLDELSPSLLEIMSKSTNADQANKLLDKIAAYLDLERFDDHSNVTDKQWSAINIIISNIKKDEQTLARISDLSPAAIAKADESGNSMPAILAVETMIEVSSANDQIAWLNQQLRVAFGKIEVATNDRERSMQREIAGKMAAGLSRLGHRGIAVLEQIAKEPIDVQYRLIAIDAIGSVNLNKAITLVIPLLSIQLPPDQMATSLSALLKRKGAIEDFDKRLTNDLQISRANGQILRLALSSQNAEESPLAQTIIKLAKLDEQHWKFDSKIVQDIRALIADGRTDAKRGEQLYRTSTMQCVRCHKIGTAGGNIGPNLVSLGGSSQLDYIVESLLEPSAKLKEGFKTVSVLMDDDQIITGLERSRTAGQLVLQDANGKMFDLASDDIVQEKPSGSLMPAGLMDSLTLEQLADVTDFLSQLGRTADYSVGTQRWIRQWQSLRNTPEASKFLNRQGMDKVAVQDSSMQWTDLSTQVNGRLPLDEAETLKPHQSQAAFKVFASTIDCKRGGKAKFTVDAQMPVTLYIDGKIVTANKDFSVLVGKHRIVACVLESPVDGKSADTTNEFGLQVVEAANNPAIIEVTYSVPQMKRRLETYVSTQSNAAEYKIDWQDENCVAILGEQLWQRIGDLGVLETSLRYLHSDKKIHVRNLSWVGDDVLGQAQAVFGDAQVGYARRLETVKQVQPSIVLTCYGGNEANDELWPLATFISQYKTLLADLNNKDWKTIVVLPMQIDGSERLAEFRKAIQAMCIELDQPSIDLPVDSQYQFDNTFRFDDAAVRQLSIAWAEALAGENTNENSPALHAYFAADTKSTQSKLDEIFRLVHLKRESLFNAFRPENETYLLLFRKHEQGNNAVELQALWDLVDQTDSKIDKSLDQN